MEQLAQTTPDTNANPTAKTGMKPALKMGAYYWWRCGRRCSGIHSNQKDEKEMIIEVNQPDQYSMARGESKDKSVSGDMRLGSEKNKSERKDARTQFKTEKEGLKVQRESGELSRKEYRQSLRSSRKAKLNATKLQLLKRFFKKMANHYLYTD